MAGFVRLIAKIWRAFVDGFAGDLQQLVKNPASDPPKTIVVFGIVLAAVLLTVIFLVMLTSAINRRRGGNVVVVDEPDDSGYERERAEEIPQTPARVKPGPREWLLGWGLFIVIIFALFSGINWYTSQPNFCRNCHVMETAYRGWKKSTHRAIGCLGCHQGPGPTGFTVRRLNYLRETLAFMTNNHSSPMSPTDNDACLKCHANVADEVVTKFNVRVKHADFLSDDCASCHGAVGHGKGAKLQSEPDMNKCLVCHDGRRATADCAACHTKDVGARMRRPKRGKIKITVTAVTNCRGCHTIKPCTEHHGTEMPHQPGWQQVHGKIAGASDNPICWRCHSDDYSFCRRCHNRWPPHPGSWRAIHKFVVRGQRVYGLKKCKLCHDVGFCQGCHEPGGLGHGPVLPNIPELLEQSGG
ncbi:MAG: NapC/NirT family cytochrome c [Actinomycetota bacterium]|nr:NapC/NirT family cytochrome c [Actinomycetota bacterium]